MSQPNPFAQAVAPAAPAQQQAPAAPVAQAPAQGGNPFGQAVAQQTAPAAPQAYAQPPYAPPAAPAQQYAPPVAQQAYAPAQPVAPAPPAPLDMSRLAGAPAPIVGEGRGAKLPHMYGRLVLVFPLSITRRPRNPQFISPEQRQRGDLDQEQVTATFVVLDSGPGGMEPIRFGGDPAAFPPVPDTESAPLPYVRKGLWVTQSRLISQLRDFLPAAPGQQGGMVLGRAVKTGPQRNDPWYLTTATDDELAIAGYYMQAVSAGQFPHPLA